MPDTPPPKENVLSIPTIPGDVQDEIRVGISSCLLGEEVRFDGGHKRDGFIMGTLAPFFRFISVCPEVEIGLGTPREAIRLVRDGGVTRLVSRSGLDHTERMTSYSREKAAALQLMGLSGYILKSASPSCGMERVRVDEGTGAPRRDGRGLFARALIDAMPLLPVEEEGRLNDPKLRENFFDRVFGYHRLRTLFDSAWTLGDLVAFHTKEKYLLLSHDPEGYTELGRLVAQPKELERAELRRQYETRYMKALGVLATTAKHVNVLQHMLGYLRGPLSPEERREIHGAVEDYRRELVPLVVPATLIRHAVRVHDIEYLRGQRYLEPHPKELMIRNHV